MKIKYSRIIMWLLILSPIMDNINGYLLLTGRETSISVISKTIIFLFCLIISVKITTQKKLISIMGMSLFFAVQLIIFEVSNGGGLSYNFSSLIKLLSPMVIIMAVQALSVYDNTMALNINIIAEFYCWFFPISLIIPLALNIGYSTYAYGVGNKGFYFSGNEIAIIMIIVLALEIDKYRNNKSKINFLNIILGIISILCVGTKSVYIALVMLILVTLFSEKGINKKILNAILFIPCIFIGLWYVVNNMDLVTQSIGVIVWRYTSQSSNFINFLLSGREIKIRRMVEIVYSKNVIRNLLIGIGPDIAENTANIWIEMDIFDLLAREGVIVSAFIIRFYVKHFKQIVKTKSALYIMEIMLVYGTSIFSGHLLFAPMASIVLVIFLLKIEFAAKGTERIF